MVMARSRLLTDGPTRIVRVIFMIQRSLVAHVMVDPGCAERNLKSVRMLDLSTMLGPIHDTGRCRSRENQR